MRNKYFAQVEGAGNNLSHTVSGALALASEAQEAARTVQAGGFAFAENGWENGKREGVGVCRARGILRARGLSDMSSGRMQRWVFVGQQEILLGSTTRRKFTGRGAGTLHAS